MARSGKATAAYTASPRAPYPSPGQTPRRSIPLVVDVFNGAVRGDYAAQLGVPGAATQIVLAFTPGVGTLCAFRDCLADWHKRDHIGVVLNLFALVPLLGGFPKTAQVLRAVHHVGHAVRVAQHRGRRDEAAAPAAPPLRDPRAPMIAPPPTYPLAPSAPWAAPGLPPGSPAYRTGTGSHEARHQHDR